MNIEQTGTAPLDHITNYYVIQFDVFPFGSSNYTLRINASREDQYDYIELPFEVLETSGQYVITLYCIDEYAHIKCSPEEVSEFRNDSEVTFVTYVSNTSDQGRVIEAAPDSLYILFDDLNSTDSSIFFMYDDGTHGDTAPGDHLYTVTARMNQTHTYLLRATYNFSGFLFYSDETYLRVKPITDKPAFLPSFDLDVVSPTTKTYAIEKPVDLQIGVLFNGSLIDDALVSAYLDGPETAIYTLAFDSAFGYYVGEALISTVGDYTISYVINKEDFETGVQNVSFNIERFDPNLILQIRESEFFRYLEKKFVFNVSKDGTPIWADIVTAKIDGRSVTVSRDGNVGHYFFMIMPNKTMYLIELYAEEGTDFGFTKTFLNVLEKILVVEIISPKSGTSIQPDVAVEVIAVVKYLGDNQPDAGTRLIVTSPEGEEIQVMEYLNGTYRALFTPQREGDYTVLVSSTKSGFREGMDSVVILTVGQGLSVPIRVERSLVIIVVALALLAIIAYYLRLF
jgi:hypothetical protein